MEINKDYKDNGNMMHARLNKGYKTVAITWTLSGLCMFLSTSINLINKRPAISIALGYMATILIFINAYNNYRKSKQYKNKIKN